MNTYMALTKDKQATFDEEHTDLLMLAYAINDDVTDNSVVTLETDEAIDTYTN